MARRKRGLYLLVGTGMLVVCAVYLVFSRLEPVVTGGLAAPETGVSPDQDGKIFIPLVGSDGAFQANQEGQDVQQTVNPAPPLTPQPDEGTPIAEATSAPIDPTEDRQLSLSNYAEATRGQVINLAGIDIKLPDDAYVEGVMFAVEPVPGREPVQPPVVVIRRGESGAAVEDATGRIWLGDPEYVVRQDLDFLIQALGEDKIVPRWNPQTPLPEVTDAPQF